MGGIPTEKVPGGDIDSEGSSGDDGGDGESNITVIAVVIVIIVIVIAAAVIVGVVMRSRNSDGAAGAGDPAVSFTNPMYDDVGGSGAGAAIRADNSNGRARETAYADVPAASGRIGTGYMDVSPAAPGAAQTSYMDVSPTAPGAAQTSYMDVSPTANAFGAGASTGYMDVSVAPAGFTGSGNAAAGYMVR